MARLTNGGMIGTYNLPNTADAKGKWNMSDQYTYMRGSIWPNNTPSTISGLQIWWDFSNSSTLTTSGTTILTASDLSGNNRNAGQYGGGARPTIASAQSGFLNRQSAYFSSQALYNSYIISGGNARTAIMVVYVKTQSAFGHLLHSGSASSGQAWGITPYNTQYSPASSLGNHYWASSSTSGINIVGSAYMVGMTYTGTQDIAIINNSRYNLGTNLNTGANEGYILGSRVAGITEPVTDSYIGEFLIYNRSISTQEQSTLYNYFKSKWGIPT